MKRLLAVMLSAAMTLSMLAGCGNGGDGGKSGGNTSGSGGQQEQKPSRGNVILTFGTGDTGGSLYPAGAALSQQWNNNIQGMKCNTQTSTGSFQIRYA